MIQLKFSNKTAYTLIAIFIFLAGIGVAIATDYLNIPPGFIGHTGNDVWISINSNEMWLQDAIDYNLFSGSMTGTGLINAFILQSTFTGYGLTQCVILREGAISGKVACSGYNGEGQLGLGTTGGTSSAFNKISDFDFTTTTDAASNGIKKLTASCKHLCSLDNSGKVKCWGYGNNGQLGVGCSGSSCEKSTPTDVDFPSGTNIIDIRAQEINYYNREFTCALADSGKVYCWGYNFYGQLGVGDRVAKTTPTEVVKYNGDSLNATAIRTAGHSTGGWACAILGNPSAGQVVCWGYNKYLQLGSGGDTDCSNICRKNPVFIAGISNVVDLELTPSDYGTACAILNTGQVKCWGYNGEGQLGQGSISVVTGSVEVTYTGASLNATKLVAAGVDDRTSFCALLSDKTVKCWGWNDGGKGGIIGLPKYQENAGKRYYNTPTDIGLSNVIGLALVAYANTGFGCALIDGGSMKCWGYNGQGQLGVGNIINSYSPEDVSISSAKSINLGGSSCNGELSACAILNDESMRCWGSNVAGQLGTGQVDNLAPTQPT